MTTRNNDRAQGKEENVIDRLVDHSNEDGRWKLKERCHRFSGTDDTWELIERLPRNSVMRYLMKRHKAERAPPKMLDKPVMR